MRYTKNPNNDGQRSFKPYPEGMYDIEITKVEEGVSSKAKSPQMVVKGTIVDGPHANKKVTMYISIVKSAVWKWEAICETAGLEPKDVGEVNENGEPIFEVNEQELVGRVLSFEAEMDEFQGRKKNDWWVKAVAASDPKGAPASSGNGSDDGDDGDFVDEEEHLGAQPATGNTGTKPRPRRPARPSK